MLSKIYSFGLNGLEAYPVTIEVDVSGGLPAVIIVGLPDSAIRESKERVRSAIKNSGYKFPPRRITVNLSPADTKKEGPAFDLAIALGILAATEQIDPGPFEKYIILGELSLDGQVKGIYGTLSISLALKDKNRGLVLPSCNAAETAISNHPRIFPVRSLKQVIHFLGNPDSILPYRIDVENILKQVLVLN